MVRTYNTYYFLAKYIKGIKSHLNESTNSKSKLLCIYSGCFSLIHSLQTKRYRWAEFYWKVRFLFMHSILSNATNQGSL